MRNNIKYHIHTPICNYNNKFHCVVGVSEFLVSLSVRQCNLLASICMYMS